MGEFERMIAAKQVSSAATAPPLELTSLTHGRPKPRQHCVQKLKPLERHDQIPIKKSQCLGSQKRRSSMSQLRAGAGRLLIKSPNRLPQRSHHHGRAMPKYGNLD